MSNAGYGNHDAPPPDAAPTTPGKREAEAAKDGTKPSPSATPAPAGRRDASTPGAGALADGRQGDDVDPGVG